MPRGRGGVGVGKGPLHLGTGAGDVGSVFSGWNVQVAGHRVKVCRDAHRGRLPGAQPELQVRAVYLQTREPRPRGWSASAPCNSSGKPRHRMTWEPHADENSDPCTKLDALMQSA